MVESVGRIGGGPRPLSEVALARMIWPLLSIGFASQLPLQVSTIFLLAMATTADSTPAVIGSLRGLGGLAALVAGVLAAPLIDRLPRARSAALGLLGLSGAALLGSLGQVPTIAACFLLSGAATAVLLPSIQAAGADGRPSALGIRAATMIASMPALAGMLSAPLLALPAEVWGWQGDYLAIAVLELLLALVALRALSHDLPPDVARPGYLAAFQAIGKIPALVGLLLGQTLRSALFAVGFTYLASFLVEEHGLSVPAISLVITLCALSFFIFNNLAARLGSAAPRSGGWGPVRLLLVGIVVTVLSGPLVFLVPGLWLILVVLTVFTGSGGLFMGGLIGLVVQRYPTQRGAVMGLNVSGINLGMFAGASLGGLGLALGGYPGLAVMLGLLGLLALGIVLWSLLLAPGRPTGPR